MTVRNIAGPPPHQQLTVLASDDDEPDTLHNRQQSLKRKAQYSRSGDADFLADPRPYKKV